MTLSQVLLACAGIALFVAIFLIVNTFTMLVAQRTKELALLRAVGATRRQVTLLVLLEALVVGLVAAAAGLVTGVGAGAGVRAVLSTADDTLPEGPLVIGATTVVAALALGVGGLVVRNAIGAVLAATGAALVVVATTMKNGNLWLGVGAVLLLTGVFVLTPMLSRPMIAATRPVLRRFGISGKLAGQNAVRNPRRTAATASALTIGLTLITGLTVIGTSANKTTNALATANLRGDYFVSMANARPLAGDTDRDARRRDGRLLRLGGR